MANEHNLDDEERQFHEVFGDHGGISDYMRRCVNAIRTNEFPYSNGQYLPTAGLSTAGMKSKFRTDSDNELISLGGLPDQAWELLGRYVARCTRVKQLDIKIRDLADRTISLLFNNLTGSQSLTRLCLSRAELGLGGIQSMVPFFENSPNLTDICLQENANINSECFTLLVEALGGKSCLRKLDLSNNNIQTVPSLENFTKLTVLDLTNNNIDNEGYKEIAKLLQNKSSYLRHLYLKSNNIDDDGAKILANSLYHNTKLECLQFDTTNISDEGYGAFLRLLCDMTSIEATYKSNSSLVYMQRFHCSGELTDYVQAALQINGKHNRPAGPNGRSRPPDGPHAAGRAKVIAMQLKSNTRMGICRLQGLEHSYTNIFANIDPILLPDLLALASAETDYNDEEEEEEEEQALVCHDDLYRMLVATLPIVTSVMNKTMLMKATVANNKLRINIISQQITELLHETSTQIAELLHETSTLTAENFNINKRLESNESERKGGQGSVKKESRVVGSARGKKRQRSASF